MLQWHGSLTVAGLRMTSHPPVLFSFVMSYFNATVCLTAKIHWVKYNPAMGKIWTNPETVVF